PLRAGTLVLGVTPAGGAAPGRLAWAGVLVRPIPWLSAWQWIVSLLTAATALLVATSLYTVVTMTRGATALRETLRALPRDLGAKVPRPPVRELSDIADGIARLAEDLAAAREAETRLGAQLAANERLTALGRVAAGVAHEVRNPLASIKLRLDLAAAGARLPEVAERAIAHASSEIARLDRLVADLLIVAGRAAGGRHETDVGALVRARAEALGPWAEGRGVSLRTAGEGRIDADADSLARAVDNLLRNAVEASAPGDAVEVAVAAVDAGERLVVRVDDRGPGVPEAQRDTLFEPFFTTKPGGTGLGLALSRAIARAHGGDLTYDRPGGVSRFELSLGPAPAPSRPGPGP
ncbi:MAG TPA: HAMP domain-containing sensor histidine kinase, partial [Polyangiaceae bacterium]|nr:HAMP domain-containing sensor histidine kinase [Polyangiaceae bacterium]